MKRKFYRWMVEWKQANEQPLPKWLEAACERDPVLARERERGEALTRSLRRSVAKEADPLMGTRSLADRVLRQIAEEDYQAAREAEETAGRSLGWFALWRNASLAALACMAVVASVVWFERGEEPGPGPAPIGEVVKPRIIVVETPLPLPELPKVAGLAKLESTLARPNPLDQEIEYMIADAKGALGFLANSFVPSQFLADEAEG